MARSPPRLSGLETSELRRWLLGGEGGRSRARGLARRVEDLVADRPNLTTPLDAILQAARALPGIGWTARLTDEGPELEGVEPRQSNPTELFLRLVRQQVMARTSAEEGPTGAAEPLWHRGMRRAPAERAGGRSRRSSRPRTGPPRRAGGNVAHPFARPRRG